MKYITKNAAHENANNYISQTKTAPGNNLPNAVLYFVNIFIFTARKLLTLKVTGSKLLLKPTMEGMIHMNQSDMAFHAGYSKTMISMILSGKKRPGGLGALRLENLTGIPVRVWLTAKPRKIRKEVERWLRKSER